MNAKRPDPREYRTCAAEIERIFSVYGTDPRLRDAPVEHCTATAAADAGAVHSMDLSFHFNTVRMRGTLPIGENVDMRFNQAEG